MRLIDGDKLLDLIESEKKESVDNDDGDPWHRGYRSGLSTIEYTLKSGSFDIPSNQGEARLREALEKTRRTLFDSGKHPGDRMAEIDVIIREALSHKGGNSDE